MEGVGFRRGLALLAGTIGEIHSHAGYTLARATSESTSGPEADIRHWSSASPLLSTPAHRWKAERRELYPAAILHRLTHGLGVGPKHHVEANADSEFRGDRVAAWLTRMLDELFRFFDFGKILPCIEIDENWREDLGYCRRSAIFDVKARQSKCTAQLESLRVLAPGNL
jgi:hypothetical protein